MQGAWGWLALAALVVACHQSPSVPNFATFDSFRVSAEGDSGQTVSGTVTGPRAQEPGLKVAAVHVIKTLAVSDLNNGAFSMALPALVPNISADLISKYDEARAKLKDLKPMDRKYLHGGWPFISFDGFWLTLFVDQDGDGQFTRGTDLEIQPIQTYYLVFQAFEDTVVSPFKKGWHLRVKGRIGRDRQTDQLDGLTLQTL